MLYGCGLTFGTKLSALELKVQIMKHLNLSFFLIFNKVSLYIFIVLLFFFVYLLVYT